MKPLALFLLVGVLLSNTSCEKSRAAHKSIVGTWELRRVNGQLTINYAPASGNTLLFTKSAYQRFQAGQRTESGTYKIVRDGSVEQNVCLIIAAGQYENRIDFSEEPNRKVFLQFSGDTLHLISGCFANDGGSVSDYVRVSTVPNE